MGTRRQGWCWGAALAGLLLSVPVAAEEAAPKPAPPAPPFWGKVSGSNVNIRMLASNKEDSTIIRVAKEGEALLIVGKEENWYQIVAPENAWCWVSAASVKETPEGAAVVKKDATLRGDSRNQARALGTVAAGAEVKILAKKAEWLKIQAPKTVGYWINDDYVQFGKAYDPAADGPILVGGGPAGDKAPPAAAVAKKDPQEEIEKLKEQYNKIQTDYKLTLQKLTEKSAPAQAFDEEGWLDSVGIFIGRPGTHALVKGGKTVCYLKSGKPDQIRLDRYFRKYVGVRGTREPAAGYEPLGVITVNEIEPLPKE